MTISTYLIKEQGRRKMRIKKISIGRYKNLHDFECEFSDSNISAFIGNNGSGKSNLLEVITKAFRAYLETQTSYINCTKSKNAVE